MDAIHAVPGTVLGGRGEGVLWGGEGGGAFFVSLLFFYRKANSVSLFLCVLVCVDHENPFPA